MVAEKKPTLAIALSAVGGILTFITGLLLLSLSMEGGVVNPLTEDEELDLSGLLPIMAIMELVSGTIVTLGALLLNWQPQRHSVIGLVILVFSGIGLFGGAAGFVAIFGILGGFWAIGWEPQKEPAQQ